MAAHNQGPTPAATHYQVLNLTSSILDAHQSEHPSPNGGNNGGSFLKRAYHRALLRNHPDKKVKAQDGQSSPAYVYTVDQIATAFAVLSSPARRADYDASLRLAHQNGVAGPAAGLAGFQTGVENVDLDDLLFDDKEERWHRSCRCGNERGYSFQEDDLVEAEDEGVLMVGCHDCSLWLKVHFAIVEDDENEETS